MRERGFAQTNSLMKGLVLWGGQGGMCLSWAGPAALCFMMGGVHDGLTRVHIPVSFNSTLPLYLQTIKHSLVLRFFLFLLIFVVYYDLIIIR